MTMPTAAYSVIVFIAALQLFVIGGSLGGGSNDGPAMWQLAGSLSGVPASWRKGTDPCSPRWDRVLCDSGCRVVSLHLSDSYLSGSLPSSFGSLILSNNPFAPSWPIPAALADCSGLVTFIANNVSLSGDIPDFFANFTGLRKLSVSNNNLSGEIPEGVARLANLELFDVASNQLWGLIPRFRSGVTLQLEDNPLLGRFPPPPPSSPPPSTTISPPTSPVSAPDGMPPAPRPAVMIGAAVASVAAIVVGSRAFLMWRYFTAVPPPAASSTVTSSTSGDDASDSTTGAVDLELEARSSDGSDSTTSGGSRVEGIALGDLPPPRDLLRRPLDPNIPLLMQIACSPPRYD